MTSNQQSTGCHFHSADRFQFRHLPFLTRRSGAELRHGLGTVPLLVD
jgi:hypothetical protein